MRLKHHQIVREPDRKRCEHDVQRDRHPELPPGQLNCHIQYVLSVPDERPYSFATQTMRTGMDFAPGTLLSFA